MIVIEDKKKHKWEGWNSSQSMVIVVITLFYVFYLKSVHLFGLSVYGKVSNSAEGCCMLSGVAFQLLKLPLSLCAFVPNSLASHLHVTSRDCWSIPTCTNFMGLVLPQSKNPIRVTKTTPLGMSSFKIGSVDDFGGVLLRGHSKPNNFHFLWPNLQLFWCKIVLLIIGTSKAIEYSPWLLPWVNGIGWMLPGWSLRFTMPFVWWVNTWCYFAVCCYLYLNICLASYYWCKLGVCWNIMRSSGCGARTYPGNGSKSMLTSRIR